VPGLGRTVSKAVAKEFRSLDLLLDSVRNGLPNSGFLVARLASLEGVGISTATEIAKGLTSILPEVEELAGMLSVQEEAEKTGPLAGMSFCLTGTMSRPRDAIAKSIEAAGGEVKSSVAKGLTFLVQADPSSTSGKSQKAAKLGVQVIGEDKLNEMMVTK
jgi:DNA ligase (NAD+)